MREIKFRALVESKESGCATWEYYTTFDQPVWLDERGYLIHVKDLQYTGLKDKNGKEIYEGDIVKDTLMAYHLGSVRFDEKYGAFAFGDCWINHTQGKFWEVIGNIYENKELLEDK